MAIVIQPWWVGSWANRRVLVVLRSNFHLVPESGSCTETEMAATLFISPSTTSHSSRAGGAGDVVAPRQLAFSQNRDLTWAHCTASSVVTEDLDEVCLVKRS